ncbi:MAG TPA: YtcA family lipoprotein [Polyangiaceae bacterium]|nr:YtcA family lipoprotein [Polyangiaceae bacterium]
MNSERERTPFASGTSLLACLACLAFALAPACDPLVDVAGAFFPGWMLCILVGIGATVLMRYVFWRTRLEASLGPLLIVYPSLATTIALALWLGLYRRAP